MANLVVLVVGIAGLAVVIGALVLAFNGKTIPDALIAIGSAAVTGLLGLLAPSPLVDNGGVVGTGTGTTGTGTTT